ncbi:ribosomal L1 domain-containing protein CG13096 [Calliopsis andreniformis]|uniref:ribosomal L1 domain-containing protein CG13096 n=1 Tax=Calliopsis andreniformis TaxID=337506 RepID=UPI003FCE1F0B
MVTSPKVVKKRKESLKSLHNLNERNTKLKSSTTPSKVTMKKTKRNVSTNFETAEIKDDSKSKELEETKLINKEISKDEKKIGEMQTTKLTAKYKTKKKNSSESEKTESEDHMDDVDNSELQDEKNTEKNDEELKRGLKRKRVTKDDVKNKKNVTSVKNLASKTFQLRTLRQQRLRNMYNKSDENSDTLNLNDLSKEHILQCIRAIFHLTEEQLKDKNALFEGESQPVFMQITCIRVPKTPRRNMRILLPHSLVSPDDDVALFVGDLQRGRRRDYEPTIEHYEDLLRKHGCTRVKTVIPLNQVKTEHDQYELKRKLVGSYDHFLVDGKIAGHLSHLLGREFYKKRKLPTSIRMQSKDLKHEIEHALKKTAMHLHSLGDTHIVQIGHTSMKEEEILENVLAVCSDLSKHYPGGWNNIRAVRIKTTTSLALPIYVSTKMKDSVQVPVVQPKRPKAYYTVKGEISTLSSKGATVIVTPEGDVTVQRKKKVKST